MPSGGARSRSGPARDPMALRRDRKDDKDGWISLPAEGRTSPAPEWPLLGQSGREAEMWATYWAKPQAVIWERDHLVEVVAIFVRQFVEGESPKASAENRKTVRMMFADLYLTSDSMSRARLRIAEDEVAEQREAEPRRTSRDRLKVVESAAGA